MKYKFLEHTADVMFEAYGKNLEELFVNSALATFDTMVDLKKVKQKITKKIQLENKDLDNLLFDWIAELIFIKDSESLVFNGFEINIKERSNKFVLRGKIMGDNIKPENQKVDVKAITLHKFFLKKENNGWKARIVLDI